MRSKFLLIPILFLFINCAKNSDDGIIFEPAGLAKYIVTNQSNLDLDVVFTVNGQLDDELDQSKIIKSKTSTILFEDGAFGFNPFPSYSFNEIRFYKSPREENNPLLTISTISNDDWNILERNYEMGDYGITEFELIIVQEDLK